MAQSMEQVADLLEKTASYVELLEKRNGELEAKEREKEASLIEKEASSIAEGIRKATGEEISKNMAKKIASIPDKDVKKVFKRIAAAEKVSPMGSASNRVSNKTAGSIDDEDPGEEFVNWILS